MKCPYCGKRMSHDHTEENKNGVFHHFHCPNCGAPQDLEEVKGEKVEEEKVYHSSEPTSMGKSKVAAGLLGIFLGGLGIHNFLRI